MLETFMEKGDKIIVNTTANKITFFTEGRYATLVCKPEELRYCSNIINDLFCGTSLIGLDIADICNLITPDKQVRVVKGFATGKDRATEAAKKAFEGTNTPIAVCMVMDIPKDTSLEEAEAASTTAAGYLHPDATIIWGVNFSEEMQDGFRIRAILF